ncbi:MAG: glycoside hydrolase family 95 protein [Paraprevotella sp.]|nr:glycoside hydrolase family 95 protein [Paraprevotella sp.]
MNLRKCFLGWAFVCCGLAVNAARVPMKLWYDRPAKVWMTSALPIGNGGIGAMFFGGVAHEQLQFNDKTWWSGSTTQRGSYQNMGDLFFDFDTPDTCTRYERELVLDDAVGRVSYTIGGIDYLREYFASNPDSVIVMRLTTPGHKGKLNFSVRMQDGRQGVTKVEGRTMTIKGRLDLLSYEAQAVLQAEGGTVESTSDRLNVRGADAVTVILTGSTNFDLGSPTYTQGDARQIHERLAARLKRVSGKSYKKLKADHLSDYRPLFARVELDLGAGLPDYPTDVLIREHPDNAYLEML